MKKSLNVLVADDDEGICKIFTIWLSEEGHRVTTATTGDKAPGFVEKGQFDVVFLDIIMPGMPCLVVLDEIKRISSRTKVVLITGRILDEEFEKELKGIGAPGYIQKPFYLEEVLRFLK